MTEATPFKVPRAALFVPADRPDRIEKAQTRGADALILDLEDAVPPARKDVARATLAASLSNMGPGVPVYVRVNAPLTLLGQDLAVALHPRVDAILLPKANCPKVVAWVCSELRVIRPDAHVIALVESPVGMARATDTALCHEAIAALAFGPEDFCAETGLTPSPASLSHPAQMIALAAKSAGKASLGYPSTIANFQNLGKLTRDMRAGKQLGFDGAMVIHPAQIAVAQQVFSPSPDDAEWAQRILEAFDPDSGVGQIDGKMIDRPVWLRAKRIAEMAG